MTVAVVIDRIECSCEKKGMHKHVSWGAADHYHADPDRPNSVRRACNRLHWYCMNVSCGCRR